MQTSGNGTKRQIAIYEYIEWGLIECVLIVFVQSFESLKRGKKKRLSASNSCIALIPSMLLNLIIKQLAKLSQDFLYTGMNIYNSTPHQKFEVSPMLVKPLLDVMGKVRRRTQVFTYLIHEWIINFYACFYDTKSLGVIHLCIWFDKRHDNSYVSCKFMCMSWKTHYQVPFPIRLQTKTERGRRLTLINGNTIHI